jgi:zinc transport system substrate-binding protein
MKFTKILIILCLVFISSCNSNDKNANNKEKVIAVSIAPLELIIKEIVEDNFTITTIISPGVSPHTYEPVPSDIKILQNADVIFYVSDDLDGWINTFTKDLTIDKIKLMDYVIKHNVLKYDEHQGCCHSDLIDPHF